MALATYSDLKSEIANWMDRTDITGDVDTFIDLGEAYLNDEFNANSLEASLTTVAGSRVVDVSSLAVDQPIALFLDIGSEELPVARYDDSQTVRDEVARRPQRWDLDGTNIVFDAPSDGAYPLRFEYDALFALSDSQTTNNLLTRHPDIYLSACIVWGSLFEQNSPQIASYSNMLRMRMPAAKSHYSRKRKTPLKVDRALRQPRHFHIEGDLS